MSCRKFEIIEHSSSPLFITETSIFPPKPLSLNPFFPSPFQDDLTLSLLDFPSPLSDLIQIETTPFCSSYKRVTRRVDPSVSYLKAISDRVNSLESKLDSLMLAKEKEKEKEKEKKLKLKQLSEMERKYSFTAEIKGGSEKKYKWTAEIEADDPKKGKKGERKYQWIAEVKGKDDDKRTYTWKATIGGDKKNNEQKENKEKKESSATRLVEIEEQPSDQRAVVLRQAYAKRAGNDKGKKKDLSPQDAATLIQLNFRAYLIRRSQALRALRELAAAKSKLKELRESFHNFSYRSRISRDAEERQKFSEKIIVLLLTVDGIEGVDVMVRTAKRSMVDELEAMLDVVDPQPDGRFLSMKRTFDMPSGTIQKEIAEGVAQVIQMLNSIK